ncbi:MAG: hypothetical protein SFU98_22860 [Leptospiraceae bacterium]|nr:hypothetical protein [Leptospiraceae bacterium]
MPALIILVLILVTLFVAITLSILSIYVLGQIFKRESILLPELGFIVASIVLIAFLGLLENRAGVIFLIFSIILYAFFRYLGQTVIHRSILFGLLILVNGLVSFKALQGSEFLIFYYSMKDKYTEGGLEIGEWEKDEKKKVFSNSKIPIQLTLPEGFFFHDPKKLGLKEETGTGKIAGVVSPSVTDPNEFPYIRFFILSGLTKIDFETIINEYSQVLDFEVHRGEIESLKFLGASKLESKNWEGRFWAYFDILKPRTSKAGFYLIPLSSGNFLLIDIREAMMESTAHEVEVQKILDSIQL